MATSTTKTSSRLWPRCRQFISRHTTARAAVCVLRAMIIATISAGVLILAPAQNAKPPRVVQSDSDCPPSNPVIDLAFLIDRSGSLMNRIDPPNALTDSPGRGQTYNVEIKGVLRALRDSTVIPQDGSIAVSVVTFDGNAIVRARMQEIDSAEDAEMVAESVENLTCTNLDSMIDPCPAGETRYAEAIRIASNHLNQNHRPGARQVLLMVTDGEPTDPDLGRAAADQAARFGVSELDVILMGLKSQSQEFQENKAKVDQIVFPKPAGGLPGATLNVEAGPCSLPGADFGADCERQVREFAELTRGVLRGSLAKASLKVNTEADPAPNTPVIGNTLSLRQAIELANHDNGSKAITFENNVNRISPLVPLPALSAPDISICGCDGKSCGSSASDEQKCDSLVTIDGSKTDTTKGELHRDGILVRSNHDTVRGLTIINFMRAGIAIEPVSQCDVAGHNRIEGNTLENNKLAGVLVLDRPSNRPGPMVHNVGNTILGNTILDSSDTAIPIDLGGDGRADNDPCDADEGPNTLLNFPYMITTARTDGGATITGVVCDPNCKTPICRPGLIGAQVEIFAVTRFGTGAANRPGDTANQTQNASDNRALTGVIPIARGVTDANGMFSFSAVSDSPTCGYTATVTDLEGNTSELMFPCSGFPKANVVSKGIEFSHPNAVPNQDRLLSSLRIENTGCDKLVVASFSVRRTGDNVENGRIKRKKGGDNDISHFSIDTPLGGRLGTIDPGQTASLTVAFDPAIPRPAPREQKLRAADVLPNTVTSLLTLNHNGCGTPASMINLIAGVTTEVHLIDPENPRNQPSVTLTRSDDNLFVRFSVFDSNLDVNQVKYEFFKTRGGQCLTSEPPEPVNISDTDLSKAITDRGLITGQSFSVIQRFSNAREHPEAGCVRVTVSDGGPGVSATSSSTAGSPASRLFELQNGRRSRGAEIVRPPLKLSHSDRGTGAGIVNRTKTRVRARNNSGANNRTLTGKGNGSSERRSAFAERRIR